MESPIDRGEPDPTEPQHYDRAVQFRLLGPFDMLVDGRPENIRGTRQRVILATLLLEFGKVIPAERLITAVWDERPPSTAQAQIYIAISKLRSQLDQLGIPDVIVTHGKGYSVQVAGESVDAHHFRQLVALGRDAARTGQHATAVRTLRRGLGLWRGEAVSDVRSRLVQSAAVQLNEDRLAVTEECLGLELELGRHHELVGELRQFVVAHPLREKGHAQLMLALYRDGRQAEALEAFRQARTMLVEEHGLDPGDDLRDMERAILEADSTVAWVASAPPAPTAQPPVPRQLPVSHRGFIGRSSTVVEIRTTLTDASADETPPLIVISGAAGVGKSALALHAARAVMSQFPDGQLYAHLRGTELRPVTPEQVHEHFLRAMGVAPSVIPSQPDALAGLYRSRLADARMLIVLDDAAGPWQVEPLLPGAPGVAVLVTSRGPLAALGQAYRHDLDVLDPEASVELLRQVIGTDRVKAEPQEAARVAELCGHLPLALQIAGGKLSVRGHWDIARMARQLGDESRRLDELSLEGTGVRATLAVSFDTLGSTARRLLLLLSALNVNDFATWMAGPLLGVELYDGADALDELVDARLVEVHAGAGVHARYRLHDLVRVFARELLNSHVPAAERAAAMERYLRCLLFLARAAHRREYGGDYTVLYSTVVLWELPQHLVESLLADPIEWLASEHAGLVASVRVAADLRFGDLCWNLAVAAVTLFEAKLHREDWLHTHDVALETTIRHGDGYGEAAVRCSRAGLALIEQRLQDAESDLSRALSWFEGTDDRRGRGLALRSLASIDRLRGREDRAESRYLRALPDLRTAGDRVAEAHVLINLAQLRTDRAEPEECERLLRAALAICTDVGARRVAAQARHRLGQLYLAQGEYEQAEAEFTEVLETTTTTDDPVGKIYAWLGIGAVRIQRGQLDQAREALTEVLGQTRRTGNRLIEGRAILMLAELALRHGDQPTVRRRLVDAEEAFTEIGARRWLERVSDLRRQLTEPVSPTACHPT
ncbi:BTAD domain-containing putative transcriptional regulator [Solwaraspora sp. WMMA2056]|uniref:AfsR/SARP family transcriptional regulator n=1 Tax=Solwaraspora sp. WMMA2056 TaxID=3015161 RepID=UPI00259B3F36|nr:BTAD domain-containing putative transcriptional regulator [Solwaraspora sp. WMMA2056]WJK38703.1 BTAD domain-containing putative transcriptional regulator [Solwaraspora sp. WMMA2056]